MDYCVAALLAMTKHSIMAIASAAWRTVAEPALLRHRERSVAIHHSDFTDYISRDWTATSSSLLAVTQSTMNVITRFPRNFGDPARWRIRIVTATVYFLPAVGGLPRRLASSQ